MKIITETTRRFVTQVVQRGADGLFFASQAVDPNYITPEEHAEFAKRYDLQVLEATGGKNVVRHLPSPRTGNLVRSGIGLSRPRFQLP